MRRQFRQFRQSARAKTTLQIHLEQPILGMDKTKRHVEIMPAAGQDRGDAMSVTYHADRAFQSRQREAPGGLRQRRPQHQKADQKADSGGEDQQESGSETEPFRPSPHSVFLAVFLADVSRRCPRGPLFPVEGAARGLRHARPLAPARKR